MKKVWMLFLLAAVCFTGKPVESQDALPLSIKVVVDLEDVVDIEGAVYAEDNEDVQKKIKEDIQVNVEHHLGNLANVEVVETSPSFVLRVILVGPIRTNQDVLSDGLTPDNLLYYFGQEHKRGSLAYRTKEVLLAFYVLTKSNADAHDFIESGVISAERWERPFRIPWGISMSVDRALEKFR